MPLTQWQVMPVGLSLLVTATLPALLQFLMLLQLAQLQQHMPVAPGPAAVQVAQDRALEKAHFVRCGVPVAPHQVLAHADDLPQVPEHLLPGILKTTRMGYDGKGQLRVNTRTELSAALAQLQNGNSQVVCLLEKRLPLAGECSVVLARSHDGTCVHLPVQLNLHRDGGQQATRKKLSVIAVDFGPSMPHNSWYIMWMAISTTTSCATSRPYVKTVRWRSNVWI
jgi:5-(carboxyamino)imidazole ribonucleotide synthase